MPASGAATRGSGTGRARYFAVFICRSARPNGVDVQLIDDWQRVARKAWSFRLIALAGMLSGCEVALPYFVADMPMRLFAALSFAVTVAALVARLVAQRSMQNDQA